MTVNHELLDRVMEHIKSNKELWNQNVWAELNVNGFSGDELRAMLLEDPDNPACGTAMCFAGHACNMSGWRPLFVAENIYTGYHGQPEGTVVELCANKQGDKALINDKAQELLGLDGYTVERLFAAGNTLARLEEYVQTIHERETLAPDGYYGTNDDYGYDTWCELCQARH